MNYLARIGDGQIFTLTLQEVYVLEYHFRCIDHHVR